MNLSSTRSRRTVLALVASGGLAALAGCVSGTLSEDTHDELERLETQPWEDPGVVVAEVNGSQITRGDFYRRVFERWGALTVLSGILKDELLSQEAARRGIRVADEEVTPLVDARLAQEREMAGGETRLREIYRAQGRTLEDVRSDHERMARLELQRIKVVQGMRDTSEARLRELYEQTYAQPQYRVQQIAYIYSEPGAVLDTSQRDTQRILAIERARLALKRIRDGQTSFEAIARADSDDKVTAENGGELPFAIPESHLKRDHQLFPKNVQEAILQLRPGSQDVSDPVDFFDPATGRGTIHLFKLQGILPQRSFAEARDELLADLRGIDPDLREIQQAIETLWRESDVRVFGQRMSGNFPTGK